MSPGPCLEGPVPIELDAVAVRIAQIESLAYAMVRGALERNGKVEQPLERLGQGRAGRVAKGDVVESGGARRRRRAALRLPGVQADVMVIPAGTEERRVGTQPLRDLKAEDVAVEPDCPLQVRDLQMDVSDDGRRIDRCRLSGLRLVAQTRISNWSKVSGTNVLARCVVHQMTHRGAAPIGAVTPEDAPREPDREEPAGYQRDVHDEGGQRGNEGGKEEAQNHTKGADSHGGEDQRVGEGQPCEVGQEPRLGRHPPKPDGPEQEQEAEGRPQTGGLEHGTYAERTRAARESCHNPGDEAQADEVRQVSEERLVTRRSRVERRAAEPLEHGVENGADQMPLRPAVEGVVPTLHGTGTY